MFAVGDVIEMFSPQAGKTKYHLCVCEIEEGGVAKFFFLNSGSGYEGDFIVRDTEIPCLPPSPTGESVISCSILLRFNEKQLKLWNARKLGELDGGIVARLISFLAVNRALSREDKTTAIANLERLTLSE